VYTFGPVYTPGPTANDYEYTDWESSVAVQKFDPSWGTLTSVVLRFEGYMVVDYGAENLDLGTGTTFTWTFTSGLTLSFPVGGPTSITMSPGFITIFDASLFDGNPDFGGTSGVSYDGQVASDTTSTTLTDQADLDMFTGTDTVSLGLDVWAHMDFNSSNTTDYSAFIQTVARTVVTVEYHYTPVPEPAAAGGFAALSLLGYIGWRRWRR